MIPAVILSVVAMVAGHPVAVACDTDVNPGPVAPAPGFVIEAWTPYGGSVIHSSPLLCAEAHSAPGTLAFAQAIRVFTHEAAHARGIQSESCAEMTADIGVFDALRRFYGVPFFSRLSRQIGDQVLALTRLRPTSYQPETCWGGEYK